LRIRLRILLPVALLFLAACSSGGPAGGEAEVISREVFIQAYVELRVAALKSEDEELSLDDRDRVLGDLGLQEEDLLRFVEVRGRDVQYMRRVWEEVDSIMTERRGIPREPGERGTL